MKVKKLTTCSALPWNFSRSLGFWVAMPTGQVSRWQTRIMTQPMTTSGAAAKPNPSAPRRAAAAPARPRHRLDVGAGAGVGVLQIVDGLGQVLDGVDVGVRRRADEADAGYGVADRS